MKKKISLLIVLVLALTIFGGCSKSGDTGKKGSSGGKGEFPNKPIELVVPYTAGGATDALARVLAKEASAFLPNKQTVVILNKPGASATLGVMDVLNDDSDGYKLGLAYTSVFTQVPYIVPNVRYDHTEFDYLMTTTSTVTILQTPKDSPIKTFEDFVEVTKNGANPITVGVMGIGGPGHLAMSQLQAEYGMKQYTPVPFKSSSEAWNGLGQGSIETCLTSADTENTEVNWLATCLPERSTIFPDVPTFKELGYDINNSDTRMVLFCKKDVPDEVKKTIYDAFSKAAQTDAFKTTAKQFATEYAFGDTASAEKLVEEEYNWSYDLLKKVGLVLNDPKK